MRIIAKFPIYNKNGLRVNLDPKTDSYWILLNTHNSIPTENHFVMSSEIKKYLEDVENQTEERFQSIQQYLKTEASKRSIVCKILLLLVKSIHIMKSKDILMELRSVKSITKRKALVNCAIDHLETNSLEFISQLFDLVHLSLEDQNTYALEYLVASNYFATCFQYSCLPNTLIMHESLKDQKTKEFIIKVLNRYSLKDIKQLRSYTNFSLNEKSKFDQALFDPILQTKKRKMVEERQNNAKKVKDCESYFLIEK